MDLIGITRQELQGLFSENISGLVSDSDVHDHLIGVLDSYVHDDLKIPKKPDSVTINDLFEQKKQDDLVRLADSYLFLCGFFPEYACAEHRLGIGYYVGKGIESYNYALYLAHVDRTGRQSLLSKLSDTFTDNANALIVLRRKLLRHEVVMDPQVMKQVGWVLNYRPDVRDFLVIQGGGEPKEKYVMKQGYLTRVK